MENHQKSTPDRRNASLLTLKTQKNQTTEGTAFVLFTGRTSHARLVLKDRRFT